MAGISNAAQSWRAEPDSRIKYDSMHARLSVEDAGGRFGGVVDKKSMTLENSLLALLSRWWLSLVGGVRVLPWVDECGGDRYEKVRNSTSS